MGTKKTAKRQSKYTGVSWQENSYKGKNSAAGFWIATVRRDGKQLIRKAYSEDDERGAAKAVDIALIKAGHDPINDTLQFLGTRKLNKPAV